VLISAKATASCRCEECGIFRCLPDALQLSRNCLVDPHVPRFLRSFSNVSIRGNCFYDFAVIQPNLRF
jgi:hypothetical protein